MRALAGLVANDVVENVVKQYYRDGFLFESYDSITGKGRGTRPFTGWTALVALLMNGPI
jgi:mannosyl-oligosaccharide glucosidase